MADAQRDYEDYARQVVEVAVARLKEALPGHKVSGRVVEGDIASSIVDEALTQTVDLIIVGSHGRKGIEKLLVGSVAEKVASHAPCSVEIVKRKNRTGAL